MQALIPHLPRNNFKMLEEPPSLPTILEKVGGTLPKTSSRSRKPKSQLKYASETALSP
jgi:hypothetical protein